MAAPCTYCTIYNVYKNSLSMMVSRQCGMIRQLIDRRRSTDAVGRPDSPEGHV